MDDVDWFTLGLDAFSLTAQAALHLAFLGRLTGRRAQVRHFALYLGLLACAQRLCVAAGWGTPPALILMLSALYAMSRLALKNGPAQSCTAALLAVYIYQLSTGAMNSLEVTVCPYVPLGLPLYGLIVLAALASLGLCWACYAFVLRLLPTGDCGFYPGLLSLPGLFFLAAELYILETAYTCLPVSPVQPGRHLALLALQALGLAALLCTLYAYRRACRGVQAQAELDSLSRSVQAQRTYVAEAQARYEKTRSFRHDLQNHLSVLSGLLSAGRTEEARGYLEKMEAASGALTPPCRTGDAAVDALLGETLARAEARGVPAEISLRLPEDGSLDGFDLCVIFANAMDNALRACAGAEEPFLRVRGQRQGDFYRLEFENSCAPGPPPEPGTGLKNIRAAAEKYGGAAAWEKTGGRFRLDVLLNISEQRGGRSGRNS
nr:GHKL domain-containing protein [uncultured Oscillibacter sp.]